MKKTMQTFFRQVKCVHIVVEKFLTLALISKSGFMYAVNQSASSFILDYRLFFHMFFHQK